MTKLFLIISFTSIAFMSNAQTFSIMDSIKLYDSGMIDKAVRAENKFILN